MSFLALLGTAQPKPTKPVRRREIFDLGEYRNNRVYYMAGNNLSIEALTAGAVVTLRFEDPDATVRVLVVGNSYQLLPFNRIYLSNAIQLASTLIIEFDYYGFNTENQATESLSNLNELLNDLRLNPLRLIDAGLLIQADVVNLVAATVILYTVPAGRAFYWLGYDLDVTRVGALLVGGGNIFYFDGLANHWLVSLDISAADEGKHTQNTFSMLRLPAGYNIQVLSGVAGNVRVNANIWGVEVTA